METKTLSQRANLDGFEITKQGDTYILRIVNGFREPFKGFPRSAIICFKAPDDIYDFLDWWENKFKKKTVNKA